MNLLSRSLPVIGHEVNLKDFLLLEFVRLERPLLYEEIFRNAGYFMFAQWRFTTWLQSPSPDDDENIRRRTEYFDRLFREVERPPQGFVLALLAELFPSVKAYLTGIEILPSISRNQEEAQLQRRVFHPDFFLRYFIFNVPADLFGEREISSFVAKMNAHNYGISNIPFFKMRTGRRSLSLTKKRFKEVIGDFEGGSGTADAAP